MLRKADEFGVTGWVRNRSDGTVEAIVHGSHEAVAQIINWAHHGPDTARVDQVVCSPATGEFSSFEKRPTL